MLGLAYQAETDAKSIPLALNPTIPIEFSAMAVLATSVSDGISLAVSQVLPRIPSKFAAGRARALTRRMVDQLKLAAEKLERSPTAVMQLIAVIALVRELRHLDKTPRWKKSGYLLVEERDRWYSLDESVRYLLGADHRMLDDGRKLNEAETEEGAQLRVLLLWLAWDIGDELTDQIG